MPDVALSVVLCICFVVRCLSFCTFFLAITLSVLLRFTDSDYPLVFSSSSYISDLALVQYNDIRVEYKWGSDIKKHYTIH